MHVPCQLGRSLAVLIAVFIGCATGLRAQGNQVGCAQIPNECCPPDTAEALLSAALAAASLVSDLFNNVQDAPSNPAAPGQASTSMLDGALPGLNFASACTPDPTTPLRDAGRGDMTVDVYGAGLYRIPMPAVSTGLLSLADLYPGLLVVDMSLPAWSGTSVQLKPDASIPRPYLGADKLEDEGFGLQPRPGNMPGQYIFTSLSMMAVITTTVAQSIAVRVHRLRRSMIARRRTHCRT